MTIEATKDELFHVSLHNNKPRFVSAATAEEAIAKYKRYMGITQTTHEFGITVTNFRDLPEDELIIR